MRCGRARSIAVWFTHWRLQMTTTATRPRHSAIIPFPSFPLISRPSLLPTTSGTTLPNLPCFSGAHRPYATVLCSCSPRHSRRHTHSWDIIRTPAATITNNVHRKKQVGFSVPQEHQRAPPPPPPRFANPARRQSGAVRACRLVIVTGATTSISSPSFL